MKFEYSYKTSDGERHEGVYRASSREAVYDELRKQGLKPFGVKLAPGFLNRVQSLGMRVLVIVLLSAALLAALAFGLVQQTRGKEPSALERALSSTVRRQPIGDSMVIESGVLSGWSEIFAGEGERFLASFAVPGTKVAVRNTSVEELEAAAKRTVPVSASDSVEARQIKAMVEGMKAEMRRYCANGGTIQQYGNRLVERQEAEIALRKKVQDALAAEVKSGKSYDGLVETWRQSNEKLQRMGIGTVPFPEMEREKGK